MKKAVLPRHAWPLSVPADVAEDFPAGVTPDVLGDVPVGVTENLAPGVVGIVEGKFRLVLRMDVGLNVPERFPGNVRESAAADVGVNVAANLPANVTGDDPGNSTGVPGLVWRK